MRNTCRKTYHAFTLVELLVVISIIAMLLAILMPALSKVRMQGQTIVCSSDLRQIALANIMYSQENKGWICPPWTFQFGIQNNLRPGSANYANSWMWHWTSFANLVSVDGIMVKNMSPSQLQEKVFKTGWLYPYLKSSKVWLCPGAPRKKPTCVASNEIFGFPPYWSYVCNATPGWTQPSGYSGDFTIKPEAIKPGATRVFLYMEQNRNLSSDTRQWDNAPFDNTVTLFANYMPGSDSLSDMHNGGGNLSFYDGHVENMKRTEWIKRMSTNEGAYSFAGNYNYGR